MRDSALKQANIAHTCGLHMRVGEELMRDSALKRALPSNRPPLRPRVGEELMRDSALKRGAEALGLGTGRFDVGEELMRDSALKPLLHFRGARFPCRVGEELMRDSALKPSRLVLIVSASTPSEKSSCATAL